MVAGRNEKCWCGSGLKYKRCHLNRATDDPLKAAEVVSNLLDSRDQHYCSCPESWKKDCRGKIVQAHSLSRRQSLGAITENGHVYSLHPNWNRAFHQNDFSGHLISARKASTFTGFCEKHDGEIFAEIDREEFLGTTRQSALVGYRTIARELFAKTSQKRSFEGGKLLDKGRQLPEQLMIQRYFSVASGAADMALRELSEIKRNFDQALLNNDFSAFEVSNFYFDDIPILVGAGAVNPTHDFDAKLIQDLSRFDVKSQNIWFALLPANQGFWLSLMWLRSAKLMSQFVEGFKNRNITSGTAYALMLGYIENCYLKPSSWNAASSTTRAALKELVWTGVGDDNYKNFPNHIRVLEQAYPSKFQLSP